MSEQDFKDAKGSLAFSQSLRDQLMQQQQPQAEMEQDVEETEPEVENEQETETPEGEVVEEQAETEDKKDFYEMIQSFITEMRGLFQNIAPKKEEEPKEAEAPPATPPQM